jgi:hypothetical protein
MRLNLAPRSFFGDDVRLIAIQNFYPQDLDLARPIRPGEALEVSDELGREWLALGFVRLAAGPDHDAMRRPQEAPTTAAKEKAILRPRENAARRRR